MSLKNSEIPTLRGVSTMTDEDKKTIEALFKSKRPNLSVSSLGAYQSLFNRIRQRIHKPIDSKWPDLQQSLKDIENPEDIITKLKDTPPNLRKSFLSAMYVLTGKEEYRVLMMDDIKEYDELMSKQEVTPDLAQSWISTGKFDRIYKDYLKIYKKSITKKDYRLMQDFILVALTCGKFIAPRRNKDWTHFKLKNISESELETVNYLAGNHMVFNNYKTKKAYGQQVIEVPDKLVDIITKYKELIPSDWLLFDVTTLKPISDNKLSARLYDIYNVSTNALRKMYMTNKYQDANQQVKAMQESFKGMGSSIKQINHYIKIST
jgi:hypothetical protein